jgi:hypothetical protein
MLDLVPAPDLAGAGPNNRHNLHRGGHLFENEKQFASFRLPESVISRT